VGLVDVGRADGRLVVAVQAGPCAANRCLARDALGQDYHARLERNYVTWVRHYVNYSGPGPAHQVADFTGPFSVEAWLFAAGRRPVPFLRPVKRVAY